MLEYGNERLFIPPPEQLIKKSANPLEEAKSGAGISFCKLQRLLGMERLERLNQMRGAAHAFQRPADLWSEKLNEYIINAYNTKRLVYCRFGEKYVLDLEKRKNSNIAAINHPSTNFASATYLINVKKLIEEHNIEGEKKDFKAMNTKKMMGKGMESGPA